MSSSHDTQTHEQPDDLDLTDVPDASAQVFAPASLLVVSGPTAGKVFNLLGPETIIGRSPSAGVRIQEGAVSIQHAKVLRAEGRHVLVDLGSTNGTFLNGRRLEAHQPVPIAPGDSIQIAETVLAYVSVGAEGHDPTRQLSKLAPVLPEASLLKLPEAQLLAQLLQVQGAEPPKPVVTIEERIAAIRRWLEIVRRNWVILFAAMALSTLAAVALVFLNPPVSEAFFTLRVSPPKANNPLGQNVTQQYDLDLFYGTTEQNFLSPGLVGESLKEVRKVQPFAESVGAAIAGLRFESVGEALYKGTYRHADPGYAVSFLKHHLERFIASEIQRSVHVAQAEVDFLAARLKETDTELTRTEKELQEFKSKHLEGLPENASGHLASRESLIARRAELGAQAERTRLELELARKQLREEAPLALKRGEGAEQVERSLLDVRQKLSEARSKGLGDTHPQVEALKRQEADLERMAADARVKSASEFDRNANAGLVTLRNRVGELEVAHRAAQAELGSVGSLVTRLDSIVETMPEVEARYAELTRSYTATKDMHAKLFDKLRSNQLQLELERASATARYEVLGLPETSGLPLRKALMVRVPLGLALGLVLGALVAALRELKLHLRRRRSASTAIVPARP
jgi:uncharacterized protein involved in exopolysaccharide biosynthesis